jgi:hypothetical protein
LESGSRFLGLLGGLIRLRRSRGRVIITGLGGLGDLHSLHVCRNGVVHPIIIFDGSTGVRHEGESVERIALAIRFGVGGRSGGTDGHDGQGNVGWMHYGLGCLGLDQEESK